MIKPLLTACYLPFLIPVPLLLSFASVACAKQDHNTTPIELSGFSISEAYEIPDDEPLQPNSPILKQLLYRIKNTSLYP